MAATEISNLNMTELSVTLDVTFEVDDREYQASGQYDVKLNHYYPNLLQFVKAGENEQQGPIETERFCKMQGWDYDEMYKTLQNRVQDRSFDQ